jgi:hypothetical protein
MAADLGEGIWGRRGLGDERTGGIGDKEGKSRRQGGDSSQATYIITN